MTLQKKPKSKPPMEPQQKTVAGSKKWQKLFRYVAEREKAHKELVSFVHLARDLAKRSTFSPDSIRDKNGGKI